MTPPTTAKIPTFVSTESPTARRSVTGLNPCRGLYWQAAGDAPKTAFLITHYDEDLSEHYLISRLVAHGYGVLGWNTRYQGQPQHFSLPHALLDIGAGVRWLREVACVRNVVMLGTSGGGSLSIIYQAEALHSTGVITDVSGSPEHTPAAAGLVSLNAHVGRPEWLTSMIDPSVVEEFDPTSRLVDLDLFAAGRQLPLDSAFVTRYRAAQRERIARISEWVDEEEARLRAAGVRDRLFTVNRVWADPRFVDLELDPSQRKPGCFLGDPKRANDGVHGAARVCTIRSWREMWDLRTARCTATRSWDRVDTPALVVQSLSDQGVFPSDAEAIFQGLATGDKHLEMIDGDHFLGEDSAKDRAADLIHGWAGSRW